MPSTSTSLRLALNGTAVLVLGSTAVEGFLPWPHLVAHAALLVCDIALDWQERRDRSPE